MTSNFSRAIILHLAKYFGDPYDPDMRARDFARLRKRRQRERNKK